MNHCPNSTNNTSHLILGKTPIPETMLKVIMLPPTMLTKFSKAAKFR